MDSLEQQVRQFRQALYLARLRYDNGYSPYLDVLDAERSLFQSEMDLATARSDRLVSIVKVCMALGGGWQDTPASSAKPAGDSTQEIRPTTNPGAPAPDREESKTPS